MCVKDFEITRIGFFAIIGLIHERSGIRIRERGRNRTYGSSVFKRKRYLCRFNTILIDMQILSIRIIPDVRCRRTTLNNSSPSVGMISNKGNSMSPLNFCLVINFLRTTGKQRYH